MFNFDKSEFKMQQEQFQKYKDKQDSGSKFMSPGRHDVKIVEADFHYKNGVCTASKDPTWMVVKAVLENAAGQQKMHYLLFPTCKFTYNEEGSKNPLFVFNQFYDFCMGFGIPIDDDYSVVIKSLTKYFKDPKKLIGLTGTIEIGFTGPYIRYDAKDEYAICAKDGKELVEGKFTKEDALRKVAELGLKYFKEFPEITAFIPSEIEIKKPKEKPTVSKASEASEEW